MLDTGLDHSDHLSFCSGKDHDIGAFSGQLLAQNGAKGVPIDRELGQLLGIGGTRDPVQILDQLMDGIDRCGIRGNQSHSNLSFFQSSVMGLG